MKVMKLGIQLWGLLAARGKTSERGAGGRDLGFKSDLGIELSGVRAADLGNWAFRFYPSTALNPQP